MRDAITVVLDRCDNAVFVLEFDNSARCCLRLRLDHALLEVSVQQKRPRHARPGSTGRSDRPTRQF